MLLLVQKASSKHGMKWIRSNRSGSRRSGEMAFNDPQCNWRQAVLEEEEEEKNALLNENLPKYHYNATKSEMRQFQGAVETS